MSLSLKDVRERAGLTAADMVRLTRLSPRTIAAIDEERYQELPAGLYARSAVRAYARAVGMDPAAAVAAVQEHLPDAPLDLAVVADLRAAGERPGADVRYVLAAAIDAGVLLGILTAILSVCGAFCALTPRGLLRAAPVAMAIVCGVPIALYFWLLGATDVPTVGPWLLDIRILPASERPLSLKTWFQRGLLYMGREVTLAVKPSSGRPPLDEKAPAPLSM